ncbi:AlbA family DNA-binding domain-containing protein [Petrocella sp. FN5]|uniref:AlbA family DNA-binding domain-containing protein n=1 Tax=Petrocella sp. FN5 TaxID=3032002 RepID=UPI0023DB56C8|nr:RNA-binding domain-containing protein [Petrocella sp. FN5]MDF1617476.1 putative DNA binding domain-containing protein [Petrocella sp. FN5]
MKIEGLKKIISSGESITVEFKESKKKLNKDVYESVCSLLNRYGGHLFLGIKDNGDIAGVDKDSAEQMKKDFVTSLKTKGTVRDHCKNQGDGSSGSVG